MTDLGPWTPANRPSWEQMIRRERFVRRAREHRLTRKAIGRVLGLSDSRVHQIEMEAYDRMWRGGTRSRLVMYYHGHRQFRAG